MSRPRLALIGGVAVTLLGATVALAVVAGRGGEEGGNAGPGAGTQAATVFSDRMRLAFTGILADTGTFATRSAQAAAGARPAVDLLADLDASLHRAQGTRDLVGASAGLDGNPLPKDLYLRSALLYAEALRALRAAVGDEPALRGQLVTQAQRLKVLSDRVYDRGTAANLPLPATPRTPAIVTPDRKVPDWEALGLAAGPPLAAPAPEPPMPGGGVVETVRQEAGRFPGLAADPKADVARRGAAALARAAETDAVVPDPEGKQEPVTLLRLAILVDAESAWTFTAAALVPPGPALEAEKARGRDLALLAEDLWSLAANRIGPPAVPDHPHFLFDRSSLEPVPVPGFGGSR